MDKEYAQYLLKKTIQDYNLIAEDFSSKREQPWPELRFLFDDYLTPGNKALDLGCGNGRFFEFCQDKAIDYFGVDSSEKLVAIAQERYPQAKFRVADALDLPFPDNYFDKVYSIAVFHHLPSEELRLRFLSEVKRVLKPGGSLIITVWKFHRLESVLLVWKYRILKILGISKLDFNDILEPWGRKIERYYHCFSERELARLVQEPSFKIKDSGLIKNERGNRQNIYLVAEK